MADDAAQSVATRVARAEITPARGVPAPGVLRMYQGGREQLGDILLLDLGQPARVLQGVSGS